MANSTPQPIVNCQASENHKCPFHGVEIERRKNTQKEVDVIKELIEKNAEHIHSLTNTQSRIDERVIDLTEQTRSHKQHIGDLLTIKNTFIGTCILGGLLITGAYAYTYTHATESASVHVRLEDKVDESSKDMDRHIATLRQEVNQRFVATTRDITDISTNQARTDERYKALTNQVALANSRLSTIIDIINVRDLNINHRDIESGPNE